MMTTFKFAALNKPTALTANGAPTFVSSGNPLVDLFSLIGSSRGKNINAEFDAAYAADRKLALKTLLWARDIRGGAGERQTFRDLLLHLEKVAPHEAAQIIPHIAEFGRWDDLLIFQTPELREIAFTHIKNVLDEASLAKNIIENIDHLTEANCEEMLQHIGREA